MIYRRIYYFDRDILKYIYLYRALLKYANFAKKIAKTRQKLNNAMAGVEKQEGKTSFDQ